MNGVLWLAACSLAGFGCLSLGREPPSQLRGWHPRVVAALVLIVIGVVGCAAALARAGGAS